MNYERNKYEQRLYDRVRIASKKIGSYALAVGLIPFFNIFGFSLNNAGLAILFFVLFFWEIWSIIRFITFNHKLKKV